MVNSFERFLPTPEEVFSDNERAKNDFSKMLELAKYKMENNLLTPEQELLVLDIIKDSGLVEVEEFRGGPAKGNDDKPRLNEFEMEE
jgi:hypothetical protein